MPIYEYECSICGIHFERFQRISDDPADICPNGHVGVRRIYSPAGIIFKGSGFYVTDNPRGNGRREPSSQAPEADVAEKTTANENNSTKSKKKTESVDT